MYIPSFLYKGRRAIHMILPIYFYHLMIHHEDHLYKEVFLTLFILLNTLFMAVPLFVQLGLY